MTELTGISWTMARPWYALLLIVLTSRNVVLSQQEGWIDGLATYNYINDLVEKSLGAEALQKAFDDQEFIESDIIGGDLLTDVTESIGQKFSDTFTSVTKLRDEISSNWLNSEFTEPSNYAQCCTVDDSKLEKSIQFKRKVDKSDVCFRISPYVKDDAKIPYSKQVLDVMRNNARGDEYRKWQYFGSVDGVLVSYPKYKDPKACDSEDPRFQKWYVESAASNPKDIVFVIDRSGSTREGGRLDIMKDAAKIVIETLNVDDRINLVAFSSSANAPPGPPGETCYGRELAFATRENKDYLSSWVEDLIATGDTNYEKAFKEAFKLLESAQITADSSTRTKVILFLTDGQPESEELLGTIAELNKNLGDSVIIFTYGIGQDISVEDSNALTAIANITKGHYTHVPNANNLRSILGTYYNAISYSNNVPVVSTPYVDQLGLGLVVSVCLPVYPTGYGIIGVTCIDVGLNEVFSEALYLNYGSNSYVFVIDNKGRTLLHPMLPNALNYGHTVYLNIRDLEMDPALDEVFASMIRGGTGSKSLQAASTIARGSTKTDGVKQVLRPYTYHWAPIPETNFSLCLVLADGDKNITLKNKRLHPDHFIYHRIDLVGNVGKCNANERLSTQEHSVVKLTEVAFKDPIFYLNQDDRKEHIDNYKAFMVDNTAHPDDDLKDITKHMLAISETLDSIWTNMGPYDLFVVWRYYGDYFGSIRIFPGISLQKAYDQTKRAWFVKAIANLPNITLTTPYLDAFGAGIVVTIAVPIQIGRGNYRHPPSDRILGVAAMDFHISFLEYMLEREFGACKSEDHVCFIVDSSGYVVYHEDIKYDSEDPTKQVEGFHLAEVEPDITKFLILQGKMYKKSCLEFGDKRKLYTWRLQVDFAITNYDSSPPFEMRPVTRTNIFLGIRKKSLQREYKCDCPDRDSSEYSQTYSCSVKSDVRCSCPCYDSPKELYQYCTNTFSSQEDSQANCVPQSASIGAESPVPDEGKLISSLKSCVNPNCHKRNETICKGIVGCKWCTTKCERHLTTDLCQTMPIDATSEPTATPPTAVIVGGAVAGGVVLIILVVIAVLAARGKLPCCKKQETTSADRFQPEDSSIYDTPDYRNSRMSYATGKGWSNPNMVDDENRYMRPQRLPATPQPEVPMEHYLKTDDGKSDRQSDGESEKDELY